MALALLSQGLVLFCRTANARYNLACATLGAMALAPVLTFLALGTFGDGIGADGPARMTADISRDTLQALAASDGAVTSPWLNWLVVLWSAGVAALSLRVAGGWYVADSMRRRDISPLPPALMARFERMREALGISRPVQFLQSAVVNAPAVVGWLRPVVPIPMSAVIELTAAQLEAVIAHELAHIRRFDALASLLQMMIEAALFYHPAVWWISRRIRVEREHCCDDVAINMSGDALGYAKALASLEEWRALPTPVLAANGGVLRHRISRLLGLDIRNSSVSVMGVAGVGLVCLAGCVVAHGADVDANAATAAPFPSLALVADFEATQPTPTAPPMAPLVPPPAIQAMPAPAALPSPALLINPVIPALPPLADLRSHGRDHHDDDDDNDDDFAERMRDMQRDLARETAEHAREIAEEAREQAREAREQLREESLDRMRDMERGRSRHRTSVPKAEDASYVAALQAAGLKDLDADEIIALKNQNVTPAYVRDIVAGGFNPRVSQIIAFKTQDIDPAYIKEIRASGLEPSAGQIVAFKTQDIDAAYIKEVRATGLDPSANQIIAFKNQGIKPAFVCDVHAVWPDAGANQIIALHVRGVSPEYIKTVRASWPDISVNDMVAMSNLGVKAADAAEYRKSGVKDLSVKQIFSYKATGVTPEFVRTLQAAGIKDLSPRDYTTAKVRGITPEFLDAVRKHGFNNLTLRQLIALKDADVL